ncbi:hypothetical protein K438DRAFT_2167395 [Mycena galopus ATCC 62051]|nr:hypothetical protein K438DRAFT_2167395 [Mycena galopus ATCC 62051]
MSLYDLYPAKRELAVTLTAWPGGIRIYYSFPPTKSLIHMLYISIYEVLIFKIELGANSGELLPPLSGTVTKTQSSVNYELIQLNHLTVPLSGGVPLTGGKLYTRPGNGTNILEARVDQNVTSAGFNEQSRDGWCNGRRLSTQSDASSDLYGNKRSVLCFGEVIYVPNNWGNPNSVTRNVSLFYQTDDKVIREMRYDGRGWSVSSFTQTGARLGTALAVVQTHDADRVALFFQDEDAYLTGCQEANWNWEATVRIYLARGGTGIAALNVLDTNQVYVFFRGGNLELHESSFDRISDWSRLWAQSTDKRWGCMTAVSGPTSREFTVYIQTLDYSNMRELSRNSRGYIDFAQTPMGSPPTADISAFVRNTSKGHFIHIYTANREKRLQQRVVAAERKLHPISDILLPNSMSYRAPGGLPPKFNRLRVGVAATVSPIGLATVYYCMLDEACALGSSWGDSNVSLFYQTVDCVIPEIRNDSSRWSVSSFTQTNAMPGTVIEAVCGFIFIQTRLKDWNSRRAINSVWEPPVHICLVPSAAPFTATTWSGTTYIRLFLEERGSICEYSGSFEGNWTRDPSSFALGGAANSMAAISLPESKLYVQTANSTLMEITYTKGGNSPDTTNCILDTAMLPNVEVAACWRSSFGEAISILHGNSAKVLQERFGIASQTRQVQIVCELMTSGPDLGDTDLADSPTPIRQGQNPAPSQRPMAIATNFSENKIWVYTQSGDGFIREGLYVHHIPLSERDPVRRMEARRNVEGWRRVTLPKPCAPWSSLCCLQSGGSLLNPTVSVFYQTRDNAIRETRNEGRGWNDTNFVQRDAMAGTAIAESSAAMSINMFPRLAVNSVWRPAIRICQAATATPIAATTWSSVSDVRLYFLDKANDIRELGVSFLKLDWSGNCDWHNGNWVVGALKLAAVRVPYQGHRCYFLARARDQVKDNSIKEFRCGGDFVYQSASFTLDAANMAGPNSAIAAFPNNRGFAHLYWAGSDKVVRQRVLDNNEWLSADRIAELSSYGPFGAALLPSLTLSQMSDEAIWISNNISEIGIQNDDLSKAAQDISNSITIGLVPFAETAVKAMVVRAFSIEKLYKTPAEALVRRCVNESLIIGQRFDWLFDETSAIKVNANSEWFTTSKLGDTVRDGREAGSPLEHVVVLRVVRS